MTDNTEVVISVLEDETLGGGGGVLMELDNSNSIGPQPLAPSQVDQVIKSALPPGYHVAKDAKVALHKAANLCVMYLEALISNEKCSVMSKRGPPKRATVSAADVRRALEDAGMPHILPQLSANKRTR